MGLDVHAVTKFKIIDNPTGDQIEDDLWQIYQPEGFEQHLGDMKSGSYYERIETVGGYRSGYGSHSNFREFLASLVYPCVQIDKPAYSDPDYDDKSYQYRFPFIHGMYQKDDLSLEDDFVAIIHFSDCEGVICNKYCKLLDKAFDKYKDKAVGTNYERHYFTMAECVKAASKSGGFLDFH